MDNNTLLVILLFFLLTIPSSSFAFEISANVVGLSEQIDGATTIYTHNLDYVIIDYGE